jgi:hypothetical protein
VVDYIPAGIEPSLGIAGSGLWSAGIIPKPRKPKIINHLKHEENQKRESRRWLLLPLPFPVSSWLMVLSFPRAPHNEDSGIFGFD